MFIQNVYIVVVSVGVAVQSDSFSFLPRGCAFFSAPLSFDVAGSPVAVDEAPGTINADSCPRVPETTSGMGI